MSGCTLLQNANYNVTAVADNAGTIHERYPYGETSVLDAHYRLVRCRRALRTASPPPLIVRTGR